MRVACSMPRASGADDARGVSARRILLSSRVVKCVRPWSLCCAPIASLAVTSQSRAIGWPVGRSGAPRDARIWGKQPAPTRLSTRVAVFSSETDTDVGQAPGTLLHLHLLQVQNTSAEWGAILKSKT